MQKQTTPNQTNALKNLDFTAWQFRHAKKEHNFIEIDRLNPQLPAPGSASSRELEFGLIPESAKTPQMSGVFLFHI